MNVINNCINSNIKVFYKKNSIEHNNIKYNGKILTHGITIQKSCNLNIDNLENDFIDYMLNESYKTIIVKSYLPNIVIMILVLLEIILIILINQIIIIIIIMIIIDGLIINKTFLLKEEFGKDDITFLVLHTIRYSIKKGY